MRTLFLLLTITGFTGFGTSYAFGQGFGYGFIGGTFGGRGTMNGAFHYGIGGEGRIAPRLTLGGEIGGISKDGTGVLASANASFHVPAEPRTLDPFLTGGISVAHQAGNAGLYVNLGGGLNYWFYRRTGFRVEFRGYPGGYDLNSFAEFRLGVVFR